jgi:endo-alpha-N-acetylgalactosaminidase
MVRFIANSQRDVWNVDPLLGGAVLKDFEGWTGQNDYYSYIAGIWTDNLPSKYIQHFELQSWTPGTSAKLTGDVDVRLEDGERVIRQGGVEVLRGGTYLLPWQSGADERTSPLQADKMYLYSKEGTANTPFTLTSSFGGNTVFEQFRLTDTGREKVGDVTAQNGRITVTAQAGIPYVLVPVGGPQPAAAEFGTFTGLSNPGFDAGTFTGYTVAGAATNELNAVGDRMAVFGADETTLSQRVTALRPGAIYDFGTYVEIGPQAERATTLRVQGDGVDAANAFSATPAENWVGSDPKHGTYMQRAEVSFVAPASGEVTVSVGAVAGAAAVRIDDWRVAERRSQTEEGNAVTAPESEAVAEGDGRRWDFEDNRGGWGPFVRGNAGGTGDARTSMSRLHQPYTQKDWKNANPPFAQTPLTGKAADDVLSGTYSLKSHDENDGLVYRSIPARLPFIPGHEYEVSFLHQTSKGGIYRWVLGTDDIEAGTSSVLRRQSIGEQHTTKRFSTTFTAGCDSTWVGLEKAGDSSGADFVLDDLVVADRGPSATEPTCALVEGTSDGELNAGAANRFVTTFTNQEDAAVTDVGMQLPELPAGWTARTLEENGNLFDTVAPGQTVQTVWLITPPADAMGASAELVVDAVYDTVDCAERSVRAWVGVSVATRAAVPLSGISATASSEEPDNDTEGSASYAIDNKPGTIWHTSWGGVAFPHSLTLDLGSEYAIDGFGYLPRASGGDNGRIKDYDVNISDDGQTWTKVADGAFQPASPTYQAVDFPVVKARWVQLVSKSSHNGQLFSAAAEVRVYGQVADVPAGFEPGVRERSTAVCTVAAPDPDVADQGSGQPDAASGDLAVTGGAALPIAAAVLGLGALALGIWLKRRRRAQA